MVAKVQDIKFLCIDKTKRINTMITYLKSILCIAIAAFISSALHAQNENSKKSMLSIHVGPSWHVGSLMGITNFEDAYKKDLRKGIAWDVSYWYVGKSLRHVGVRIAPGFFYQGSTYKKTHDTGADKIQMHYLAPQFGIFFIRNHYQIQAATGIGYQFYKNKSTVYGKPREVEMNRLACNFSLSGEYFLSKQWGVSTQLNWLISHAESYQTKYHDQTWKVIQPKSGYGYFGQLSLLFGLNYHF